MAFRKVSVGSNFHNELKTELVRRGFEVKEISEYSFYEDDENPKNLQKIEKVERKIHEEYGDGVYYPACYIDTDAPEATVQEIYRNLLVPSGKGHACEVLYGVPFEPETTYSSREAFEAAQTDQTDQEFDWNAWYAELREGKRVIREAHP